MKAHLPQLPSCLVLLPYIQMCPNIWEHPPQPNPTRVCPLVKTGGEFRPTQVHNPFSLLELRWMKQDLGSYTDDPGKYTETFQHITLAFDLMWKDIMVIFSQTLSDLEYHFSSVAQSCPILCDPMNRSTPGCDRGTRDQIANIR